MGAELVAVVGQHAVDPLRVRGRIALVDEEARGAVVDEQSQAAASRATRPKDSVREGTRHTSAAR